MLASGFSGVITPIWSPSDQMIFMLLSNSERVVASLKTGSMVALIWFSSGAGSFVSLSASLEHEAASRRIPVATVNIFLMTVGWMRLVFGTDVHIFVGALYIVRTADSNSLFDRNGDNLHYGRFVRHSFQFFHIRLSFGNVVSAVSAGRCGCAAGLCRADVRSARQIYVFCNNICNDIVNGNFVGRWTECVFYVPNGTAVCFGIVRAPNPVSGGYPYTGV